MRDEARETDVVNFFRCDTQKRSKALAERPETKRLALRREWSLGRLV